jgi:hypothetical protein
MQAFRPARRSQPGDDMNGTGSETDATVLDLVSFKWLMAGRGWWVDLSRLREDATYARACVQRGLDSGLELLRQRSVELQPLLPASRNDVRIVK